MSKINSGPQEFYRLIRDKDSELRVKDRELLEKDNIVADKQAQIEKLTQTLRGCQAELERTRNFGHELAAARKRPGKMLRDLMVHHLLSALSAKSSPLPPRMAARFARSAEKRDPLRSIRNASDRVISKEPLPTPRTPPGLLDARKKAILLVSHETSRTGVPILTLNLIQQFSARYNVIALTLGGGDLTDDFRKTSAALYEADRLRMSNRELRSIIKGITAKHAPSFAIVNSVESRMVLRALRDEGVPTVSLVHEFASYIRPRSALRDVIDLSTETVFSTRLTLENAVADLWMFYPGAAIHVAPQGLTVSPSPRTPSDSASEKEWLSKNLRPEGEKRKFLVLGVGTVELRKGVDLFVECATIVAAQPGGDRFQFVWIGKGFDPDHDTHYSVYLADQIKRAGIEPQLKILRSTSEIELAYQTADLLLLSSRLDPLPNVTVEALAMGLSVVCFEKTTGIADFLSEIGLAEHCVAKYLDTNDLARKVVALANSEDLRADVSGRSRAAAKSAFDMSAYASKLEAIALQAVGAEEVVRREVEAIVEFREVPRRFLRAPGG